MLYDNRHRRIYFVGNIPLKLLIVGLFQRQCIVKHEVTVTEDNIIHQWSQDNV